MIRLRIFFIKLFGRLAARLQGDGMYYRGKLLTPEQVKAYDNFGWPRA